MKKIIASMVTIVLLLTTVTGLAKDYPQKFYDVPKEHWAFEYIAELVDRGVINGYDDGSFKPDSTITRAEWAKIMVGALNKPLGSETASYSDMNGHWANTWVNAVKAYLRDFENGTAFRPDIAAVREDVTVSLVRYKGCEGNHADYSHTANFKDQDSISNSLRKYIAVAVEHGLISGFEDGTFRGQATLTRAEAATLLWRASQKGDFECDKVSPTPPIPTPPGQEIIPTPTPMPTPAPTPTPTPPPTSNPTPAPTAPPTDPPAQEVTGNKITGSLTFSGEKHTHTYTASISGTYHFAIQNESNISVKIVRDDGRDMGTNMRNSWYYQNNFNADLEAGRKYSFEVTKWDNFTGTNTYSITITVPDPTVDVSGKSSFSGSLRFIGEKDTYSYTPTISGTYNFTIQNESNINVKIVRDDGRDMGTNMRNSWYYQNNFTADLEAGQQYSFKVEKWDDFTGINTYTITITAPQGSVDVSASSPTPGQNMDGGGIDVTGGTTQN